MKPCFSYSSAAVLINCLFKDIFNSIICSLNICFFIMEQEEVSSSPERLQTHDQNIDVHPNKVDASRSLQPYAVNTHRCGASRYHEPQLDLRQSSQRLKNELGRSAEYALDQGGHPYRKYLGHRNLNWWQGFLAIASESTVTLTSTPSTHCWIMTESSKPSAPRSAGPSWSLYQRKGPGRAS